MKNTVLPKKSKFNAVYFIIMLFIIILLQFADSFNSELYDKLQSFFITEFVINKKGIDYKSAASYFGAAMLPCYLIAALTPIARSLADRIGMKKLALMNLGVMIAGLLICTMSHNLILFLIGNSIITLSCSLDIQYMFIAVDIQKDRRGTVRGIAAAVAALSSMLIPIFKNIFISEENHGWRSLYYAGMALTAAVLVVCLIFMFFVSETDSGIIQDAAPDNAVTKDEEPGYKIIFKSSVMRKSLLTIAVIGIATAGITYYNEPMLAFKGQYSEKHINTVLFIQPLVTMAIVLSAGIISDIIGRKKAIILNHVIAASSLSGYCISIYFFPNAVVQGIFYGFMIGTYFTAVNLKNLDIMELSPKEHIGKFSAAATLCYGIGDAAGMVLAVLLVKFLSMGTVKILLTLPVLIAAILLEVKNFLGGG